MKIEPSVNLDMIVCGVWLRSSSYKKLEEQVDLVHQLFRLEIENAVK